MQSRVATSLVRSVVGTLIFAGAVAACSSGSSSKPTAPTNASSCIAVGDAINMTTPPTGIEGVKAYRGMSQNHGKECVNYPQTPPVGGNHNPVWESCAFYDKQVPTESAVHSMEHGAVWIVYSPELDATQVGVVKALGGNPYVLISPWASKLASPIMVQAWGLQLALPNATDPRLKQFLTTYASGPQTPEPGVQCLGGGTMTV